MIRQASFINGLLSLLLVICACSSTGVSQVRAVSVKQLWQRQQDYEGQLIRTSGVLQIIHRGQSDEYLSLVSKDGQYRVALATPDAAALRDVVGQEVDVMGEFEVTHDRGGSIAVEDMSLHWPQS
jgi:hypothetical protein